MSKPAKITMKIIKDVDMNKFDELKRRINAAAHVVNVGVPSSKREADGTPVAMIAAVHEFGSPAQGIPERPFLTPAIKKNRLKYVRLNRINLVKMLRGQMTAEQALGQLGEMAKGDVQVEIRHGSFAPLKPATIRARERNRSSGYNQSLRKKAEGPIDRPLIDTGQLVQSIAWEIEE